MPFANKDFMDGFRFARAEMQRHYEEDEAAEAIAQKIRKKRVRAANAAYERQKEIDKSHPLAAENYLG